MAFKLFSPRETPPAAPARPLIAVIDDEQDICHMLSLALERRGYAAATANDGEAGLALVREKNPAAILLDIMMPSMNGYEMLARVQKNPALAAIPVIVLSSIDSDKQKSEAAWAESLQVARFISKPLDAEAVADCVAEIVPIPAG